MGRMEFPEYGLCDMHCHMIPGVDDGSADMDMSVRMMRADLDNCIDTVILTPHHKGGHHNVRPGEQSALITQMADAAWDAGMDVTEGMLLDPGKSVPAGTPGEDDWREGAELVLFPGNEILYDSGVAERLERGLIQTLAGTSYVLLEFRPDDPYARVQEGLRALAYEGYRVVVAHCERYDCLREDFSRAEDLVRGNVVLQVNADSVLHGGTGRTGRFGRRFDPVAQFVQHLLDEELVSLIATDAHRDAGARSPDLLPCWQYLMRRYDPEYVREITRENALRILRDEDVR